MQIYEIEGYLRCMSFHDMKSEIELAVFRIKGEEIELNIGKYYPKRAVVNLSKSKILELTGVIKCLCKILKSEDWHIEHKKNGAPILFENGVNSKSSISISHTINNEGVAYSAVVLSREQERIGVDIVLKNDSRLARISNRVMSDIEIETNRLAEVWACKEAVFKARGPGLDFKNDIKVEFIEGVQNNHSQPQFLSAYQLKWLLSNEGEAVVVMGPIL
ncbi:MAG: hypothetical protein COA49_01365 [Bacteroidetes bacterium]|nr:MAG: hypothetical protein COA49_01365 [Bacteroidota bacterium]